MYFARIDAQLKYVQVAVLDRLGELILGTRVPAREPHRLLELVAPFRPLASPSSVQPLPAERLNREFLPAY